MMPSLNPSGLLAFGDGLPSAPVGGGFWAGSSSNGSTNIAGNQLNGKLSCTAAQLQLLQELYQARQLTGVLTYNIDVKIDDGLMFRGSIAGTRQRLLARLVVC